MLDFEPTLGPLGPLLKPSPADVGDIREGIAPPGELLPGAGRKLLQFSRFHAGITVVCQGVNGCTRSFQLSCPQHRPLRFLLLLRGRYQAEQVRPIPSHHLLPMSCYTGMQP